MGKVLPKLTVPDKTWKVWKQKSGKMEENMKKKKKRRNNSIKYTLLPWKRFTVALVVLLI